MKAKRKSAPSSAQKIPTFPPGYVASQHRQRPAERAGVKRWLIRAAADDRGVVVVDAVNEDEALERAQMMRHALQSLGVWPTMPLVYAEPHGDGPVTITWFREGMFQMLEDLKAAT